MSSWEAIHEREDERDAGHLKRRAAFTGGLHVLTKSIDVVLFNSRCVTNGSCADEAGVSTGQSNNVDAVAIFHTNRLVVCRERLHRF